MTESEPASGNLPKTSYEERTMELFEAIGNRRSYRGPFRYQQVPVHDLERIVQAGLDAPSARNSQTTTFIIVTDKDIIAKIASLPEATRSLETAPALIACITDLQPGTLAASDTFEIENCAAAVENMLLATTALGYASVWLDRWLRHDSNADSVGELLNLPHYKAVRVILPIGVPSGTPDAPDKKPFEKRVDYNSFGQKTP